MRRRARLDVGQLQELRRRLRRTKEASEVRKIQAILMVEAGEKIEKITGLTGLMRSRIFELRQDFDAKGLKAIEAKPRRVKELLTKAQIKEIEFVLKTQSPDELGYEGYLGWTTSILAHYVERQYEVRYKSKTSYYVLFHEAKFTFHKPGRKYARRDEGEVAVWRKTTADKLAPLWDDSRVVILAGDEMSLSTQTTTQKVWLPVSEYPRVEVSAKKESRSVYGFLNLKTGQDHAFKAEWQNMYITAGNILPQVRELYPGKKIILLWDQAGWHKGSEVKKWLEKDGLTEIIHYPAAAPEENPQEHVWKAGRNRITHNRFIQNIDMATDDFVQYLNATPFAYSFLDHSPHL